MKYFLEFGFPDPISSYTFSNMKTPPKQEPAPHDDHITIPLSVRLPAKTAVKLYLYSERMNTSAGKLLASLLDDVLPAFETPSTDFKVKLRLPQVYKAMQQADLLNAVNQREVEDRLIKRTEPGGQLGRPAKSRSIE
jgi:hypothetical protein